MNKLKLGILLFGLTIIFSCKKEEVKPTINGLWLVTKVKMGEDEMTPVARWMHFNADSTQTSGNGWLQHSEGTWNLNKNNQLTVINTNGLLDEAEPFTVEFENNNMIWTREEFGQQVEVTLEKTDKTPTSEANKLYGLWKFDTIFKEGKEVSDSLNPSKKAMLFLRWDSTYELRNYPEGVLYGIFKTHGHRQQIDMVSYSKEPKYQFYEFKLDENKLLLKSTNSNTQIKLTRIYQFLE